MGTNGHRSVQATRTKVVMERATAVAITDRLATLERLLVSCRDTIETQRTLLSSALVELAQLQGASPKAFSIAWLREHGQYVMHGGGERQDEDL